MYYFGLSSRCNVFFSFFPFPRYSCTPQSTIIILTYYFDTDTFVCTRDDCHYCIYHAICYYDIRHHNIHRQSRVVKWAKGVWAPGANFIGLQKIKINGHTQKTARKISSMAFFCICLILINNFWREGAIILNWTCPGRKIMTTRLCI